MKTKVQLPYQVREKTYSLAQWYMKDESFTTTKQGRESITYEDGRRLPSGHWPWKECHHVIDGHFSGYSYVYWMWEELKADRNYWRQLRRLGCETSPHIPRPAPSKDPWNRDVLRGITDQLDLNKGESVLLYSGILQAVPLVGAAFKFVNILNQAGKKLAKSFRKKPFTTVVQSLVSADFIDRFVISPTIDDARKFLDASNYVLRVLDTAYERNMSRFGIQSEYSVTHEEREYKNGPNGISYMGNFYSMERMTSKSVHKAFALLEAKYDINAATPVKLWARRMGITRPLDSAWDLIPFSFVIDYFTRAGDFISALSDEMSNLEGLKGTITKIHDLWGSIDNRVETTWSGYLDTMYRPFSGWRMIEQKFATSTRKLVSSDYRRFRVSNPWGSLLQLQDQVDDYLSINVDLSSTKKRTLAELIIQARLRRP